MMIHYYLWLQGTVKGTTALSCNEENVGWILAEADPRGCGGSVALHPFQLIHWHVSTPPARTLYMP